MRHHSLGDTAGHVHTGARVHEDLPGDGDKLGLQGGVVCVDLCLHPSMVPISIVIVRPASVASTLLTVVIVLLGLRIVVILSASCDCG